MKPQNILLNLSWLLGCPEPWTESHSLGRNCNRGAAWRPGGEAKIQPEEFCAGMSWGIPSFAVNLFSFGGFCPVWFAPMPGSAGISSGMGLSLFRRHFPLEMLILWGFAAPCSKAAPCTALAASTAPGWLLLEILVAVGGFGCCQAVPSRRGGCFVWVCAPSIMLAPALGCRARILLPTPSPALWQSLSCQELLEETQILHFSQALGQS